MKQPNNTKIDSIEALRTERLALRKEARELESEIRKQYLEITDNFKPLVDVIQKVNRIKQSFTLLKSDNSENIPGAKIAKLIAPVAAIVSGGLLPGGVRKVLIKSIVGYGVGSAAKFILSKSIAEHKEAALNLFKNKKERVDGIF